MQGIQPKKLQNQYQPYPLQEEKEVGGADKSEFHPMPSAIDDNAKPLTSRKIRGLSRRQLIALSIMLQHSVEHLSGYMQLFRYVIIRLTP